MNKGYQQFEQGKTVSVAECYLTDECTEHMDTSATATIVTEPSDDEELVGIVYESGELDYVPQDILEINK